MAGPRYFRYARRMTALFEEIAFRETEIGELSLRRRRLHRDGDDIWEITLNGGYLMSSQFVDGEIALAELALQRVSGQSLDVVVGGLGLGYTAHAALQDPRVARLSVVELIPEVIEWHRHELVPLGSAVAGDPRTTLIEDDFFARVRAAHGIDTAERDRRHDAILIDIDHSTRHFIDEASSAFYSAEAIAEVVHRLTPGGIFALWSTDERDDAFVDVMHACLVEVEVERVEFATPYRETPAFNLVYLGRKA